MPNTHRRRWRDLTVELSRVAVWTQPSAVVTQFTISCAVGDKWRHNDVIVEEVISIDQNSRSQAAMESVWLLAIHSWLSEPNALARIAKLAGY